MIPTINKNLIAASWKLSLYQVWNRKRRRITLGLLFFPIIIVACAALFGAVDKAEFYKGFVTIALGSILIPFVALFWGSGVLADEIEGKTLVYLWTRPRHRGLLILCKLIGSWPWLLLLAFIGIATAYLFSYSSATAGGITENFLVMFWDWRALALAALAYSSLGFLLSVITKRPLVYGLLIAYMWELIPRYGPGFFKRLSITQQMLTLATHKTTEENFAGMLIDQAVITETEAILTLIGIIVVCLTAATFLAGKREFLADDPARNQ